MLKGNIGNRSQQCSELSSCLFRNEQGELTRVLIGINLEDPVQQDPGMLNFLFDHPMIMLDSVHTSFRKANPSSFIPYAEEFSRRGDDRASFAERLNPSLNHKYADEHIYYGWHWRAVFSFINQYYQGIGEILSDIFPFSTYKNSWKTYFDRISPDKVIANPSEKTLNLMCLCCLHVWLSPSIMEKGRGVIYVPRCDEATFKKYQKVLIRHWRAKFDNNECLDSLDPKETILKYTNLKESDLVSIPIVIAFHCQVVSASTEHQILEEKNKKKNNGEEEEKKPLE